MIKLKRTGRYSVDMTFDDEGLDMLLNALTEETNNRLIRIEFDRAIINHKKTKFEHRDMLFVIDSNADNSEISDTDEKLIWILEAEDYEFALFKFEESKKTGYFSPGEFIDIKDRKVHGFTTIYCVFTNSSFDIESGIIR